MGNSELSHRGCIDMPEIANCPVCGKEPEVWCREEEWRVRITCCKHVVYSTASWNRYAAAMELAEAKTWEEETYAVLCWLDELPDRKCAFNDSVDLNIYAERACIDALEKVYEVFK